MAKKDSISTIKLKSIEDFRGRVPAKAVANYVLDWCSEESIPRSNLDLQKLVYFCHVTHLVQTGKPLVRESFEAWPYGPVIPSLYRSLRKFGREAVTEKIRTFSPTSCSEEIVTWDWKVEELEAVRFALSAYGKLSTGNLVRISHVDGGPWERRFEGTESETMGSRMFNSEIYEFYAKRDEDVH